MCTLQQCVLCAKNYVLILCSVHAGDVDDLTNVSQYSWMSQFYLTVLNTDSSHLMMEYITGTEEEGAEKDQETASIILCCECGTYIESNPTNMCVACLRTQVDISEGIPKQSTLYFCRNCERYLQPPGSWISATLESHELLSMCLKRLKGLNKVRLVDAGFIWTEPHSKRIKVKVSIQKEVTNGAVLQQVFVIEYVIHNQMCDDCHRVEAKDYWRAVVQIRQKTFHKKTLLYLEQTILKHKAHVNTTSIKQVHDGLDFYYSQKQDARKLVDFLQNMVPCRLTTAQELVSHDIRSNIFNYKHTFSIEIVPICKDSIVCMPVKLAQQLGQIGQLCLVSRVTQTVHLIDPNSCQIAEVSGPLFWRHPFNSLCNPKQMTQYIVMQCDPIFDKDKRHVAGRGTESRKHVLADIWVVKASELGTNEQQFYCRSHLGHLLSPGDTALGFDLRTANVNDVYLDKMKPENIPDVVLVKKLYSDPMKRARKRKWRLEHMTGIQQDDTASNDRDYNDFLEDLEEDPAYRQNVNIYKDKEKLAVDQDETDDEDFPRISLADMLDDLCLEDDPMGDEDIEPAAADL